MDLEVFEEIKEVISHVEKTKEKIRVAKNALKNNSITLCGYSLQGEEKDRHLKMFIATREHHLFFLNKKLEKLKEKL